MVVIVRAAQVDEALVPQLILYSESSAAVMFFCSNSGTRISTFGMGVLIAIGCNAKLSESWCSCRSCYQWLRFNYICY